MPVNLRCKRWQITSNVRVSELALTEPVLTVVEVMAGDLVIGGARMRLD
jgi:hypothetical protein